MLLAQLLQGVQDRGLVLEPALAPRLLELARVNATLREAALAAAGSRGPWLAAQNPQWAGLVDRARDAVDTSPDASDPDAPLDESPWELGDSAARLVWLRRARQTHPARAGEIMAAALAPGRSGERVELRQGVVAVIAGHPTLADADILEQALDDRAVGVRDAAVAVLSGLAGTAYEMRATGRARRWVDLESRRGLLGRRSVHVAIDAPTQLDPADVRDGIGREAIIPKAGAAAGGLLRMRAA
ncbi:MAG: DUF5691 domain-containing protein, partial [Nostocoides sp.]